MSNLVMPELIDACTTAASYEATVTGALYDIYKTATVLANSICYEGDSATQFKGYINSTTLNLVNGFLSVAREITETFNGVQGDFQAFESSGAGHIDDVTLDFLNTQIGTYKNKVSVLNSSMSSVYSSASQYIGVASGAASAAYSALAAVSTSLSTISTNLAAADASALSKVNTLYADILKLKQMVTGASNYCNLTCKEDYEKLDNITKQDWYVPYKQSVVLNELQEEDPFEYKSGNVSVGQKQWAAGSRPDVYAFAGGTYRNSHYVYSLENGVRSNVGGASVLSGSARAQYTDYLSASATAKILAGDYDLKAGWKPGEYMGAHAEGSVAVAKAAANAMIGPENANIYGKAEASFLTADGFAAAEFKNTSDWKFGVGGEASLASASASVGFSLFEAELSEKGPDGKKETTHLLSAKASASAKAGGGAKVAVESKRVLNGNVFDLSAVTVDLGLYAFIGVDLSITVPVLNPFGWGK